MRKILLVAAATFAVVGQAAYAQDPAQDPAKIQLAQASTNPRRTRRRPRPLRRLRPHPNRLPRRRRHRTLHLKRPRNPPSPRRRRSPSVARGKRMKQKRAALPQSTA